MKALLALLLLVGVAHAAPTIRTVDEKLANGLHVIVAPDSTVNSIGVFVRHDDCAAALAPPANIDAELDRVDGFVAASFETSHFDAYVQVPAGALELALWFEAKRMAKPMLAPAAAPPDDDYSKIDAAIEGALRPHIAIASDEAHRCVAPERATIAIVGRVDEKAALVLARKYFAGFPASKFPARNWRVTARSAQTVKLRGSSSMHVRGWTVPRDSEATAMVLGQRLTAYGIEPELRNEQFRIVSGDLTRMVSLRGDLVFEKRLVDTQLLTKLESLRYRASVLASGKDIDKLRADIAAVTNEDLGAFTTLLDKTPAVDVEVTP